VSAGSYLAVRSITDRDGAATAQESGTPGSGDAAEPVAASQTESAKPILAKKSINGILVGADVQDGEVVACLTPENEPRELTLAEAAESPLNVTPKYLPDGVEFLQSRASACGATVVFVEREYLVAAVTGTDGRVQNSGGVISIRRILRPSDRIQLIGPEDRFEAITSGERRGVMLRPLEVPGRAAGIFPGTIAFQEPTGGFTVIQGSGLPWDEIVRLARSVE
jgi:hypothetical protein